MKKIMFWVLCILVSFLISSCGGGTTPSDSTVETTKKAHQEIKPMKILVGKWRQTNEHAPKVLTFTKSELTTSNPPSYGYDGILPTGGSVFEYSYKNDLLTLTDSSGGKDSRELKFYSNNLIGLKNFRGKFDLYVRCTDKTASAAMGAFLASKSTLVFPVKKPDYKKALPLLTEAAESGELDSQLHLAKMYAKGEGVKKNVQISIEWAEAAASGNYPGAYNLLSRLYFELPEPNHEKIVFALNKAISSGSNDDKLKLKLAEIYATVPKHYNADEAMRLFNEVVGSGVINYKFKRLAAAIYALSGDFEKAIQTQKDYLSSAKSIGGAYYKKEGPVAKIVLDQFYSKNRPYDSTALSALTQVEEQKIADQNKQFDLLVKEATTASKTIGTYPASNKDKQQVTLTITDVAANVSDGNISFYRDMENISLIAYMGQKPNIKLRVLNQKARDLLTLHFDSSEVLLAETVYDKLLSGINDWREKYPQLTKGTLQTKKYLRDFKAKAERKQIPATKTSIKKTTHPKTNQPKKKVVVAETILAGKVKQYLVAFGYLESSEVSSSQLKSAIKRYERDNKLLSRGRPSQRLLSHMKSNYASKNPKGIDRIASGIMKMLKN